jgi:hypothetical protein
MYRQVDRQEMRRSLSLPHAMLLVQTLFRTLRLARLILELGWCFILAL